MTDWRRPVPPWPLFTGLVVLHALAALMCWALADLSAWGQGAEGSGAKTQYVILRGTSVAQPLSLLLAWRGQWGFWLASIAVPLALVVVTGLSISA